MARILVVSRNAAMAMGLSSTDHDVVDLRPPAFQDWMSRADRDLDALVLDLDEPEVALDAVTQLRARALLAPALLVSSNRPGWDSDELRHLPAAQVLPLPISRPALVSALEDLLSGNDFDVEDGELSVLMTDEPPEAFVDTAQRPEPEPVPGPTPEPVPFPEPEPIPGPTPEPVPGPSPEPVPGPEPEPVPEPERIDNVHSTAILPHDDAPNDEPSEPQPGLAADLHHLMTAQALEELLAADDGELGGDEVPVPERHDYQRELGLHARPELPVPPTPVEAPREPAPPTPDAPAPDAPVSRVTASPAPPAPAPRQRGRRAVPPSRTPAQRPAAAARSAPAQPSPSVARSSPGVDAGAPAGHSAARLDRVDPVLLVRRLLERADELYGVPETAEVVITDAVERTHADAGALLVPDDGHWRVAAGVHLRPLEHRFELRADSWLVLEIARGNKGAIIEESDIARQPLQGAPLASWRHLLATPIPHIDGLILLARSEVPFGEEDLLRMAELGNEAGPLLANAIDVRRLARTLDPYRDEPGSAR